jgi:hypothetical protein
LNGKLVIENEVMENEVKNEIKVKTKQAGAELGLSPG